MPSGDPVTVDRGQGRHDPKDGISCTLDRATPEWFATTIPRICPRNDGIRSDGSWTVPPSLAT
jgi:hypothetical protein